MVGGRRWWHDANSGVLLKDRAREGRRTLQRVFNPTVARSEVATGRPYGHKVQKCSLGDTKSAAEKDLNGTKPIRRGGGGSVGSVGWRSVSGRRERTARGRDPWGEEACKVGAKVRGEGGGGGDLRGPSVVGREIDGFKNETQITQ